MSGAPPTSTACMMDPTQANCFGLNTSLAVTCNKSASGVTWPAYFYYSTILATCYFIPMDFDLWTRDGCEAVCSLECKNCACGGAGRLAVIENNVTWNELQSGLFSQTSLSNAWIGLKPASYFDNSTKNCSRNYVWQLDGNPCCSAAPSKPVSASYQTDLSFLSPPLTCSNVSTQCIYVAGLLSTTTTWSSTSCTSLKNCICECTARDDVRCPSAHPPRPNYERNEYKPQHRRTKTCRNDGCDYGSWSVWVPCRREARCSDAKEIHVRKVRHYDCRKPDSCTDTYKTTACRRGDDESCAEERFRLICRRKPHSKWPLGTCAKDYVVCHQSGKAQLERCSAFQAFDKEGGRCADKKELPECIESILHACQLKDDGAYPIGACNNEYFICTRGKGHLKRCEGLSEIFDPRVGACAPAKERRQECMKHDEDCEIDGAHAVGRCDRHYKYCSAGRSIRLRCPEKHLFDRRSKLCTRASKISDC